MKTEGEKRKKCRDAESLGKLLSSLSSISLYAKVLGCTCSHRVEVLGFLDLEMTTDHTKYP